MYNSFSNVTEVFLKWSHMQKYVFPNATIKNSGFSLSKDDGILMHKDYLSGSFILNRVTALKTGQNNDTTVEDNLFRNDVRMSMEVAFLSENKEAIQMALDFINFLKSRRANELLGYNHEIAEESLRGKVLGLRSIGDVAHVEHDEFTHREVCRVTVELAFVMETNLKHVAEGTPIKAVEYELKD